MLEPGGDDDRRDRDAALRREATRLLWRYVVEVVEAFDLCPWARRAREQGEVRVEVVTATGGDAARDASVAAAVERIAGDPDAVMGMVVLARDPVTPLALRRLRDAVLTTSLARVVAIADFHPAAAQDLGTAARAVPWLRRSPDPTLQVVRLAAMASLRGAAAAPARATQAAILAGHARAAPRPPTSEQVAELNLATARAHAAAVEAAVAAIHADRDRAYAAIDAALDAAPR
ncbi:MAG: DUF1415 family protein [Kofleriaceae bacterium]|nr:DUF1415 family protein [Kofleriaceae bacterium]